jgi:putative phage-type endonuclease
MEHNIIKDILNLNDFFNDESLICKIKNLKINNNNFSKENLEYIVNHIHKSKKKGYYFNFEKKTKIKKKIFKLIKKHIYLDDLNNEKEEEEEDIEELEKQLTSIKNNDKITFNKSNYSFPEQNHWSNIKKISPLYEPFGTQWVHDIQKDDTLNKELIERAKIYDKLRGVVLPEQRSAEWFSMRRGAITASDGGVVLGKNKHEKPYEFILKKTIGKKFTSNKFCYHGKMLEEPATMVYQYRMNVTIEEFGLMMHPSLSILGASPDGIVNHYKLDKKHKTKYVGRMLEIKCPAMRKIKMEGPIKDHICPIYYWIQVQLQLECCNLEECDFWQCKIKLYKSREEFIADTDEKEPFRSKQFGFEKGCLIQLMPLNRANDIKNGKYWNVAWEDAKFIYPKEIEMTPYDCDKWVMGKVGNLFKTLNDLGPDYKNYYFDKVVYWRLEESKNVTINRDRKWFSESLPIFQKIWRYVLFLRKNKSKLDLFVRYIKTFDGKRVQNKNKKVMDIMEKIYNK